jgi:hypothetical protein
MSHNTNAFRQNPLICDIQNNSMRSRFPFMMMAAFLLLALACTKNNNGGKPSISIENITTTVDSFSNMVVNLKFHTSGATLSGGSFSSLRMRLNENPPTNESGSDTITNPIPSFPNEEQGELNYVLPYVGYLSTGSPENDTLVFKFWAIDVAGHSSDTISSPKIIILN